MRPAILAATESGSAIARGAVVGEGKTSQLCGHTTRRRSDNACSGRGPCSRVPRLHFRSECHACSHLQRAQVLFSQRPPSPPPPSPTVVTYQRKRAIGRSDEPGNPAWDEIYIRLVGKHPLWGHLLCVKPMHVARNASHSDT